MNRFSKIAASIAVIAVAGAGVSVAYAHKGEMSGRPMGPNGQMMQRLCGADVAYKVGRIGDRIAGRLKLTDAEKPGFKDLEDTVTKALNDANESRLRRS